jgi:hypothetical protein
VLLLGEDSVVGLESVFLEELLVTGGLNVSMCEERMGVKFMSVIERHWGTGSVTASEGRSIGKHWS